MNKCLLTSDGILKCNNMSDTLKPYRNLDTNSVFGRVSEFGLKNLEPFVIVKYPRKEVESANLTFVLLHELFVGLLLNELRKTIPTFMYTYGGLYCTVPTKSNDMICSSPGVVSTMCMVEKIKGDTLHDVLSAGAISIDAADDIVMQIVFALFEANKKFGYFQHYDLHEGNIMLVSNTEGISITYDLISKPLIPRYIAQIIDFGMSAIRFENKIYISPANSRVGYVLHIDRLNKY